jgi:hypothetical protein
VAFYRDFVVALLQGSCRPSACPVTSLWETTLSSPRNDFGAASLVIFVHEYNPLPLLSQRLTKSIVGVVLV